MADVLDHLKADQVLFSVGGGHDGGSDEQKVDSQPDSRNNGEFAKFKHCLNLIRCSLTHINLMEQDPEFKRPQWLVVKLRDTSETIKEEHVSWVFSAFGDVSVRKLSNNSCLVAMPSVNMAAGLLVETEHNEKYVVKRYQPPRDYHWNVAAVVSIISVSVIGGILFARNRLR